MTQKLVARIDSCANETDRFDTFEWLLTEDSLVSCRSTVEVHAPKAANLPSIG